MLWERLGGEEGWEIEIGMQYAREKNKKYFIKIKERKEGRKKRQKEVAIKMKGT